jgi:outer membrane protein OmpA-like peptidoglycan-associated protein
VREEARAPAPAPAAPVEIAAAPAPKPAQKGPAPALTPVREPATAPNRPASPPEAEARRTEQVAALPPAASVGESLSIPFEAGLATLPGGATSEMKALAIRLLRDQRLRVQVMAYAAGDPESESAARRMSLSRALAIRTLLIEEGVRSTRIDVRALGDRTEKQPVDRVDIVVGDP